MIDQLTLPPPQNADIHQLRVLLPRPRAPPVRHPPTGRVPLVLRDPDGGARGARAHVPGDRGPVGPRGPRGRRLRLRPQRGRRAAAAGRRPGAPRRRLRHGPRELGVLPAGDE